MVLISIQNSFTGAERLSSHYEVAKKQMTSSVERISTGKRIVNAKDDPSNIAISNRLNSHIKSVSAVTKNLDSYQGMFDKIDATLEHLQNITNRIINIARQSNQHYGDSTNLYPLRVEKNLLEQEFNEVAANFDWNGLNPLDNQTYGISGERGAETFNVQFGTNAGDNISAFNNLNMTDQFGNVNYKETTTLSIQSSNLSYYPLQNSQYGGWQSMDSISDSEGMLANISRAKHTLQSLAQVRVGMANNAKMMETSSKMLFLEDIALHKSFSTIQDADYALEATKLAKSQILAEASTALLAQANASVSNLRTLFS